MLPELFLFPIHQLFSIVNEYDSRTRWRPRQRQQIAVCGDANEGHEANPYSESAKNMDQRRQFHKTMLMTIYILPATSQDANVTGMD